VEGPKEYATIWVEEEPKTVPVVVRSEKDCQLPFPLPAGFLQNEVASSIGGKNVG